MPDYIRRRRPPNDGLKVETTVEIHGFCEIFLADPICELGSFSFLLTFIDRVGGHFIEFRKEPRFFHVMNAIINGGIAPGLGAHDVVHFTVKPKLSRMNALEALICIFFPHLGDTKPHQFAFGNSCFDLLFYFVGNGDLLGLKNEPRAVALSQQKNNQRKGTCNVEYFSYWTHCTNLIKLSIGATVSQLRLGNGLLSSTSGRTNRNLKAKLNQAISLRLKNNVKYMALPIVATAHLNSPGKVYKGCFFTDLKLKPPRQ